MNYPNIISDWLKAQEHFDNVEYANCFSENAVVYDEGKTHNGKEAIRKWNEKTNEKYQTKYNLIEAANNGIETILTIEVSGIFDGSPVILKYYFEIINGKIQSLKVVG